MRETMRFGITLGILLSSTILWGGVKSQCSDDCDALASYYIWNGTNLSYISSWFSTTIDDILSYNPQITDPNHIFIGRRLNVPFSCGCINNQFMGHQFTYRFSSGRNYQVIAQLYYSNLTTEEMMRRYNSYPPGQIPDSARLNVTVNCSCGNSRVSRDYGLFVTYPLRPGESLTSIANQIGLSETLLQDYNPGVDFGSGSGLVFIPGRDHNGAFPPLTPSSSDGNNTYPPPKPPRSRGLSAGAIAGISTAAVVVMLAIISAVWLCFVRRNKRTDNAVDNSVKEDGFIEAQGGF